MDYAQKQISDADLLSDLFDSKEDKETALNRLDIMLDEFYKAILTQSGFTYNSDWRAFML